MHKPHLYISLLSHHQKIRDSLQQVLFNATPDFLKINSIYSLRKPVWFISVKQDKPAPFISETVRNRTETKGSRDKGVVSAEYYKPQWYANG